jgi:VWFA-related protein
VTRLLLGASVALLVVTTVSAQRPRPSAAAAADLVELDVVALDRNEPPVNDLRRDEFTIKEDGHTVDLKTFAAVAALGSSAPDDGRVVVLLMDDIGIPVMGTSPMQQIAPAVLSPIGDGDEVSVVRLASRLDEAFGDITTARERIGGYRGGAVPYSRRDTPETMLRVVAKISAQLESIDHRRKVILCLGLPAVCDVGEPALGGNSVIWPAWVAAIGAAARANVGVYCIDPTGVRGGQAVSTGGLVQLTGGKIYAHENDFLAAANAIWREAGHYYLLGYWPEPSKHEVRTIDVSVARKGVHVRARRRR